MPTNTLTDARCKGSKPMEKGYKLFDGKGLFLYVAPTGTKTWRKLESSVMRSKKPGWP